MISPHITYGFWKSKTSVPKFKTKDIIASIHKLREPIFLLENPQNGQIGIGLGGESTSTQQSASESKWPLIAMLPPLYPEWLGCRSFTETHKLRFPYVSGAMANGIATTKMVIAMAQAGFLGFFGSAGLQKQQVEKALDELQTVLGDNAPWGCNLIHSPNEPALEESLADLYIKRDVNRVSASAYMALTPAIVRFALSGIYQDSRGKIQRQRFVFAKISRPEVARHFLEPAPDRIIDDLLNRGLLSKEEARIGRMVPVAEDIMVESDSGGHTDNRPLSALFPSILKIRDQIAQKYNYPRSIRVGAAGGLGTPTAVAAAFSMGAAFVVTGSVNQACVESGLDEKGRKMLAEAGIADVIMAPAADMFEMGVEVQVLRSGTMFAVRGRKLYELYKSYPSLEAIPKNEREKVESQILGTNFESAWQSTKEFWQSRDPKEIEKAQRDPKHKMALVFRSYLGQSSRWAIAGDSKRRLDYQIWCGPAMGAFNKWTKGTFLEDPANRNVVQVARNLMEGAAVVTRAQQLRTYGLAIPTSGFDFIPRPLN